MKTNGHDRTAIGAILLGTAGALALSMLFFARAADGPQVRIIEMDERHFVDGKGHRVTHPVAEAWRLGDGSAVTVGTARRDDNFTPYEVTPRATNTRQVLRALQGEYPTLLRDAGIGGSVRVWFFVDEEGVVQENGLREKSGYAQLDAAALAVAEIIEFTPAMNEGKNIPMWISLPITFEVR